jgi:hypothetical protein
MLIRRWRCGLRFSTTMDLDQPLKFTCALAALFYPTFRHCSSSTIPHIISSHSLCNAQCGTARGETVGLSRVAGGRRAASTPPTSQR